MSDTLKINICADCLLWQANGTQPDEYGYEVTPEDIEAVTNPPGLHDGWTVAPGSDHAECEHDLYSEDCPEDEGQIPWSPCDLCHRSLGGDRYPAMIWQAPTARLEYLRQELRAERISYGELAELEDLAPFIDPGDTELLEAAWSPEFGDDAS